MIGQRVNGATRRAAVLEETGRIVAAVSAGTVGSLPELQASFPLQLADDERLLAFSPFRLDREVPDPRGPQEGMLWVSTHGCYFQTGPLFAWPWELIESGNLIASGVLHWSGRSRRGPVAWVLESDLAELVFALWALAEHPRHPQLVSGNWLAVPGRLVEVPVPVRRPTSPGPRRLHVEAFV